MKKEPLTTSDSDDKNFNPIVAIDSELFKNKFKELALTVALKELAKLNDLSLKQQVEITSPAHWNISPGLGLDEEFEAFKRCGSQGFISITEQFDFELANKKWYSKHCRFRNKQIIINPDHIGFTSNQTTKKPFIKTPVYIDKTVKKSITKKDIRKKQIKDQHDRQQ